VIIYMASVFHFVLVCLAMGVAEELAWRDCYPGSDLWWSVYEALDELWDE